jgi:hypothetical protein
MSNKMSEDQWYTKEMLRLKYYVIFIEVISGNCLLVLAIHSFYVQRYIMAITCIIIGLEFLYFFFVDIIFFRKLHPEKYSKFISYFTKPFNIFSKK